MERKKNVGVLAVPLETGSGNSWSLSCLKIKTIILQHVHFSLVVVTSRQLCHFKCRFFLSNLSSDFYQVFLEALCLPDQVLDLIQPCGAVSSCTSWLLLKPGGHGSSGECFSQNPPPSSVLHRPLWRHRRDKNNQCCPSLVSLYCNLDKSQQQPLSSLPTRRFRSTRASDKLMAKLSPLLVTQTTPFTREPSG